jgi:hypothetical protein
MSEQSGRSESSERPGSEQSGAVQPGSGQSGSAQSGSAQSGSAQSSSAQSGSSRSAARRSGSGRSASERSASARARQSTPASDMLSDLQRWLLRSSARSMGREIGGQVRRTLGGGRQQASAAEVWDTATNEIPPEVGESPECQWCPICRAARRMRDSGPGVGGQLSGVGDAVASVVQDAVGALDSILSRGGGPDQRSATRSRPPSAARSGSASATAGRGRTDSKPDAPAPRSARRDGPDPGAAASAAAASAAAAADAVDGAGVGRASGPDDPLDSLAGEHGSGGWKPGDRLATEHVIDPDPWAGATGAEDGVNGEGQSGKDAGAAPNGPDEAQLDGQGHGPDDRG